MHPPSHSRRVLVGMALASLLFTGVARLLLGRAVAELGSAGDERRALASLRALADVAQRAGGKGDAARAAVAAWDREHPWLTRIRLVSLEDISLEASTAPEDQGEKAAPRPLTREEKDLFDRASNLRSAVDTNQQEGEARLAEVEVGYLPFGGLTLAVPVAQEGTVVAAVSADSAATAPGSPDPMVAVAVVLSPLLLLFGVSRLVGERRSRLVPAAAVLLLVSMAFYLRHSLAVLERERRVLEAEVAAGVARDAAQAAALIREQGLPAEPALAPDAWDADAFGRPRGLISAAGRVDEARLGAEIERDARQATRALVSLGLVSLAVLLLVGLGAASRVVRSIVAHRQAYAYITPAMVGMVVLVFFPFIYGITLSFTGYTLYNVNRPLTEMWLGLTNYLDILTDFQIARRAEDGSFTFNYYNFYYTLFFNIAWTVCNVVIGVTGGLVLALALNTKGLALRPIYRVLLILPWAMPNYITALIWKGMFHRQFGVVNQVLAMVGIAPVSWFDSPLTSFLTVLATNGWLSFPFMMVVTLGALQSIPAELYEAARVDGATRWQQLRAITLPALKPALVPAIILSVVWTFNMFNVIFLVSAGEPAGATEILITQAYKFAFEKYRYGYAAAYSTIILGILVVYGSIQNRLTKATEAV